MISDQIVYFVLVIGVLVAVHEFGHFIAARACRMRTDIFSIGFGARLFGFNKRAGFRFRENPPNKITLTLEQGSGVGGTARHLSDGATFDLIAQISRDAFAKDNIGVISFIPQTLSHFPEKIAVEIVLDTTMKHEELAAAAGEMERALELVLHSIGIVVQRSQAAFAFDGGGFCDYRVSLLPIGGYVKIAGMVDESMDASFASRPPQPWEFRAHPAWQKFIVICAGVAMNVLLAFGLYSWLSYSSGEEILLTRTVGSVAPGSMAQHVGFRAGDEIAAVDGERPASWNDMLKTMFLAAIQKEVSVRVHRGGADTSLMIPYGALTARSDSLIQNFGLFPAHTAVRVHDVIGGTPAERAGLQPNDLIVAADSVPMASDLELMAAIHARAGRRMELEAMRDGVRKTFAVVPDNEGHIGVRIMNDYTGPRDTVRYTVPQAALAGAGAVALNFGALGNLLWKLVTGRASVKQNLAGPVAIAKMAGRTAQEGMAYLLALMASLSISLAGLNILPIPALDGGHLVFIIVESAIRREVSNKVKMAVQQVGFALLLALMIFIVFNDLSR